VSVYATFRVDLVESDKSHKLIHIHCYLPIGGPAFTRYRGEVVALKACASSVSQRK
jgi:hypothetical protein